MKATVEECVEALLSAMTLAEKVGQMTLAEKNSIRPGDTARFALGGVLSGGGGYPILNTPRSWADMVAGFQDEALATRLRIPVLYGVDAVHGHAAVEGATVFPHNCGLGPAGDPDLVYRIARATAVEMAATGTYWNYAPTVAIPHDLRWGRTYECFGTDPDLVSRLGAAYVRGLQGTDLASPTSVLATPKHFVGDGAARWGTSTTVMQGRRFLIDQGDADLDEAALRSIHLRPYRAAIGSGARCIMVSFSSWHGVKMHAHQRLLTDVLKGELGFRGFLVSDWGGIDQLPGDYHAQVVASLNAGLDMIMVPYDYRRFVETALQAVRAGDVPLARVDDAVRRILNAKFALGLFEHPLPQWNLLAEVGCREHRVLAREAVRRSLCLLKDARALPLPKDVPFVLVAGEAADDLGIQCGGWTIEWQGKKGPIVPGTTIRAGIEDVLDPARVAFDPNGRFEGVGRAPVGIVVLGEEPHAEGFGDKPDLALTEEEIALVRSVRAVVDQLVLVVVAGRPYVLGEAYGLADAVVAAWLPGSEGAGVADVLFGDAPFEGRLPFPWPRSSTYFTRPEAEPPLFPPGFGLGRG
ncbi:MAG TPA: glycoside hydrolase family 3 N-terminal domain-containing protein [Candidatus Bipolaricaulis anaerobius]|nr:glycoside hydrolase family 3 N-terminal domain-containing protein [Candidatus Bipolaricaulis anaerobius]HNS23394.1 glycoside hydrolase family 3 N-terminal domain-containing protein [Candidatus Bipolaricaulis anaerobius]